MEHGELRHTVTLQRPEVPAPQDTAGQPIVAYLDVLAVKASIEQLSARERFTAEQYQASATHRIRMHYRPALAGIDATWRVIYGTRIFELAAPPNNVFERNRIIELLCIEGPLPSELTIPTP
jgi:SPP1 family predicted phage head-tail adaptor